MIFNDTTSDEQGMVNAIRDITQAENDSYPIEQITRNVNKYVKKATSFIQHSDKQANWDDSNATTLPIENTNLVLGQRDYSIDSDVRYIERVSVLDNDNKEKRLTLLPAINGALDEVFSDNGTPKYYELLGESILIYPSPDYDKASGLQIRNKRSPELFVPTDTTKEPGFDEMYHEYLVLGASFEYVRNDADRMALANSLKIEMQEMEQDMIRYYSLRSGKQILSVRVENNM